MTVFRRRSSDHVDPAALAAYRDALRPQVERIEGVLDLVAEVAEDLRRRIREPDDTAETLTDAEAELEAIAAEVGEQLAPEPLRALHAEFDANLERALRGLVTIERGCGLSNLPFASPYDDEPQAYWKRGHLNVIHAQMRMREIAEVLFTWKVGTSPEASVSARIQQMGA